MEWKLSMVYIAASLSHFKLDITMQLLKPSILTLQFREISWDIRAGSGGCFMGVSELKVTIMKLLNSDGPINSLQ